MNAFFEFLFSPLQHLSPALGLSLISIVLGVVLVVLYGKLSSQKRIRAVKKQIWALLLESILFRRDLILSLRAQAGLFKSALTYFLLAVPALLVLMVPCLLVLAQLNSWIGLAPFAVHQPAVVTVTLKPSTDMATVNAHISSNAKLQGPVRIKNKQEISWRVDADSPGTFLMDVEPLGLQQPIEFGSGVKKVQPLLSHDLLDIVFYPHSVRLPAEVEKVTINYPERSISVLGKSVNWMLFFFVVSLLSGLAAAKVLHIEV